MTGLWAYCPAICDGHFCPQDCDNCPHQGDEVTDENCTGDCDNCMFAEVDP